MNDQDSQNDTPNADDVKNEAKETADKMVSELKQAFERGRDDAKEVAGTAFEQAKKASNQGAYGIGFGAAFAAQFVAAVLEDVVPQVVKEGAAKGNARGRAAGEDFKEKVAKTARDVRGGTVVDAEDVSGAPAAG